MMRLGHTVTFADLRALQHEPLCTSFVGVQHLPQNKVPRLGDNATKKLRRQVIERATVWQGTNGNGRAVRCSRCRWCAKAFTLDVLTLDHVQPRAWGGPNHPDNVVLACKPCNFRRQKIQQKLEAQAAALDEQRQEGGSRVCAD